MSPDMSPERAKRSAQLLAYVQDSIQKLKDGETTRLPTYRALASQFGYRGSGQVYQLLGRRSIRLEEYYKLPEPSPDLAWFLGIVSAGGSTATTKNGSGIYLRDSHEGVLEKFRLIGERTFLLNAHKINPGEKSGWNDNPGHVFCSARIIRFLGDLKRDSWARTILSTHPWVIDNSRYTWGFINGFFEKRGSVYILKTTPYRRGHRIAISTSSQSGANLLAEMLVRQGLENPSVQYYEYYPTERVKGTFVQNLRDIELFAQHVHSVIPEKEKALEHYRTGLPLTKQTKHSNHQGRLPKYTRERLVEEWQRISEILDGGVSSVKINQLNQGGQTDISYQIYANRFGQGSFVKAREELERIIRAQESQT